MQKINELTVISNGPASEYSTWSNVPFLCTQALRGHGVKVNLVDIIPWPPAQKIRDYTFRQFWRFDVAVDIRRNSSTFGRWVGVNLSAQNHLQLWVSKGSAHGFFVLSGWAEVIYKTTDYYAPEWERVLLWNDPALGIGWPICDGHAPILSGRDSQGLLLNEAELFEGEAAG